MIEVKNVSKTFEKIETVKKINLTISESNVFGMLGTNGAGKSTLLRMMAGVIKPDEGEIFLDGKPVWDNPSAKKNCFYISDDQYFFPNATANDMAAFYKSYYTGFLMGKFTDFLRRFQLDGNRKVQTYSKGMKKQLSLILGVCANVPYLFCDETFDGLDPVMRQGIKAIFAKEMDERGLTPVIASHNLRELEDICDHVGLLHAGGVLLSKKLEDLKFNIHKVQFVLPEDTKVPLYKMFDILKLTQRGRLIAMTLRGEEEEIRQKIAKLHPVYEEMLPLTLEEIFICETEVIGYDIKNLIY